MQPESSILSMATDFCQCSKIEDGYSAARAYKYYCQFSNSKISYTIPERRVAARALYKHHKDAFDRCIAFFLKCGLDVRKFIKFMANDVRLHDSEIDSKFMSKWSLNRFAEMLASDENNIKVYNWYMKSVKMLAAACLDSECVSAVDFIRKLIREKKLASWVVCGKISAYYLAAIPDFPNIVQRLDSISRDELSFISNRYDMYNTAVNKATLAFENRRANPIRSTDEMVEKLRSERRKNSIKNDLFDSSLD